ncbi:DUF885 domain-containing protein [Myxococcus qinghaiensis]|uniref:DUF885 domain-containing protein n=1 Tax=Myxococcus qinghaiensis TaxID=2906758 RepID=UPI0020A7E93A|nr:DUF885 domain-containing protein [Myxococcus qinghaiensis]MCP3169897.1 DUF885 domain-containing protein [Myxococcus qinghaiensis]
MPKAALARALLLSACWLFCACARQVPASAPESSSGGAHPPENFSKLVDTVFEASFDFSPSNGTAVGLHAYDNRLEDLSRPRIEARIRELDTLLARLRAVDKGALSFDDTIDAEALEGQLLAEHYELSVLRSWEHNPMLYAGLPGGAIDGLMKRDFAPKIERLRSVIARLKAVPAVFAAGKANVQTPPREFTELALRMAKGSVGFFEGSVATWAKDAAGNDAVLQSSFLVANRAAVAAVKDYAQWLEKDLLQRSTGKYALGEERFLTKLRYEEMIDLPLPELLARGEANLEKDYRDFVATAKRIDPRLSPAQVMARIEVDHPTAQELIPTVRRSVEGVREFLVAKDLVTIPSEVRPHVEETPPYARSGSFASMDTPGPYEQKASEAFYYVTPVEPDWDAKHKEEHLRLYNAPVVSVINIHEVWPGHYLQFLYAPRFPTKVRKLVAVGSNAEGWAHYAEQMMLDQGFGNGDPKLRLAQLSEALLRDCRYVAGIKLHTAGWTVEEAARLFVEKCFQQPANAHEEARRGAYNPTYLYYTFGKLEVQRLAQDYQAAKGQGLKQFHDAFVAQGSLPLPLVRRLLLR